MKHIIGVLYLIVVTAIRVMAQPSSPSEPHRPQFHFSPKAHWMNDPNGMFYLNGTYHLFFQYYPESSVWGPMHWGHATSPDLMHWHEQPIALYPDSLGWIFSGSAVVDVQNTSGFGRPGQTPIVAIFTHHNNQLEKEKKEKYEYQSLAYSLDEGKTWTKYDGNPVLPNPGISDFRDPKVRWFEPQKKWIMTLATKDRITFYSSPNLKTWTRESDFGSQTGAHGGVWECPDLFPLTYKGRTVWVLLVSINPGGPNGGSATQYFLGDFDGKTFTAFGKQPKWMDYGPDNYAGVTFSNLPGPPVLMGWMSNWNYAQKVPTETWRSATTLPRTLALAEANGELQLTSNPVPELNKIAQKPQVFKNLNGTYSLTDKLPQPVGLFDLTLTAASGKSFDVVLSNPQGDKLIIGYDAAANAYFVDRTQAGHTDFELGFGKRSTAPRLSASKTVSLRLVVDVASVEVFADGGLSVMTSIFFPRTPFSQLSLVSANGTKLETLTYRPLMKTVR